MEKKVVAFIVVIGILITMVGVLVVKLFLDQKKRREKLEFIMSQIEDYIEINTVF